MPPRRIAGRGGHGAHLIVIIVSPASDSFRLSDLPGEYAYSATEWEASGQPPVVLLERHHSSRSPSAAGPAAESRLSALAAAGFSSCGAARGGQVTTNCQFEFRPGSGARSRARVRQPIRRSDDVYSPNQ